LWQPEIKNIDEFRYHHKKEIGRIAQDMPEYVLLAKMVCESLRKYVGNVRFSCGDSLLLSVEDIRDSVISKTGEIRSDWAGPRTFHIPDRSFLERNGINHDFVLLISDFKFSSYYHSYDGDRRRAVREGFRAEFSYSIWDFKSDRLVT